MIGAYTVQNPDYVLSPFTGMTRKHYIECAKYRSGASFPATSIRWRPRSSFPVVPGKTYPQPDDPPWR